MIDITYNRGFVLKFESGFSVSVQLSKRGTNLKQDIKEPVMSAFDATISIYDKEKLIVINESAHMEYQNAENVALWVCRVSEAQTVADILKHVYVDKEEEWQ